ncbi:hypothetical protein GCM10007424_27330 [Flavobacterium suaedae]|uniref:Uncharacterized protein n=1 Tax=Flavobacterium suaedae TaxID=1767027 RepID=A0ABQ1K3R7_9FLAO|nr:hypothetical protein [Flavobacterium suaedae]GGB85774.1 hypothetical protein GCM10007424_27330 [Flavobacterium suaedae]
MKNFILSLGLVALLASCSSDDSNPVQETPTANKVVMLKVDLETNVFEGGKELTFPEANSFTISTIYNEPGDFGDITLKYEEVNETIFAGDIVWMGLGEMTYPETLNTADDFLSVDETVAFPMEDNFQIIEYSEYNYYPESIDYSAIWGAIDNLQIVQEYRDSNPDSKINLFLYTPSVGVGNPAEWDWYVILKN